MAVDGDSYNKGGLIAFLFCMVFSFVFFIYIAFVHPGVDLKEVQESAPGAGSTVADVSPASKNSAAKKVDVSGLKNPWVSSEELITHGISVYQVNCAVCHGSKGEGDGPAGKALKPPPKNLITGEWKKGGTSIALYTSIQKGLEGTSMAAFGHLPKVDRWALVHYIRSITKDKPKDDNAKLEKFAATAE